MCGTGGLSENYGFVKTQASEQRFSEEETSKQGFSGSLPWCPYRSQLGSSLVTTRAQMAARSSGSTAVAR